MASAAEEPNRWSNLGTGAGYEAEPRATVTKLFEGLGAT